MTDIGVFKQPFQSEDRSWDRTRPDNGVDIGGTLDVSLFTQADHFPNGYLPSGTVLARKTSTGLLGPYAGDTKEVQTITEGGSGLTSFTLTFGGDTTDAIAAAATAAQVQAALEALDSIGAGNVLVTGSAGGPYTVTFENDLAGEDVAQMTATPTGGSGTVTIATTTAGGANAVSTGLEKAAGILKASVAFVQPNGTLKTKVGCALRVAFCDIDTTKLPFKSTLATGGYLDDNAKKDLPLNYYRS